MTEQQALQFTLLPNVKARVQCLVVRTETVGADHGLTNTDCLLHAKDWWDVLPEQVVTTAVHPGALEGPGKHATGSLTNRTMQYRKFQKFIATFLFSHAYVTNWS
jgi:hypothetical protein